MKNSNYLITIIIGDENSSYDGKILSRNYNNNYLETIHKIKKILSSIDYDLDFKENDSFSDIIFNLISTNHIVFVNESTKNKKIGYLYLPINMTLKQEKTLNKFMEELNDYYLIKFSLFDTNSETFKFIEDICENESKILQKRNLLI